MGPRLNNSNLPRRALATGAAVCAHLLALLAMGWRVPRTAPPTPADTLPPVQIHLLRPAPATSPASRSSPAFSRARPSAPRPDQAEAAATAPAPPAPAPPSSALAAGPPDCAPEDLALLTETEKARCRNAIDADNARRLARGADQRAARQVAEAQRGPQTYRMDAAKEAYYGAVADAYWQQSHGPPMAGHTPGVGCSVKFSGWKIVKMKPTPNSLNLGPCFIKPPQGFLTEESRIAPP